MLFFSFWSPNGYINLTEYMLIIESVYGKKKRFADPKYNILFSLLQNSAQF